MDSIFWIAASRWAPRASDEGSLKFAGSVDGAAGATGVGVFGALLELRAVCAGASGAAGVRADAGAGVCGGCTAEELAAGCALG